MCCLIYRSHGKATPGPYVLSRTIFYITWNLLGFFFIATSDQDSFLIRDKALLTDVLIKRILLYLYYCYMITFKMVGKTVT